MSYSSNSGGTLSIPSPTHIRNSDFTAGIRTLRRSLSRSPSKFHMKKSPSGGSPSSPFSPSPLTPSGSPRQLGTPFAGASAHPSSPLATPFPPSVKLSLRSARHKTPSTHHKRISPRSPLKRVLSESLDKANTQPQPSRSTNFYGENLAVGNTANPPRRKSLEKPAPQKSLFSMEIPPTNPVLARLNTDIPTDYSPSPLKRSDSATSLDWASWGTPVPKRRSMHGSASFGQEFNVFDQTPTSTPEFDIHEDKTENILPAPSPIFSNHAMNFANANMPRRSTSLRKSTLQQRQEKSSSWNKRQAERNRLAALAAAGAGSENGFGSPVRNKDRPRLSLDQFIPPQIEHPSPFNLNSGPLLNPSMHFGQPPVRAQHPLATSLTQSSSSGSLTDDSPTHVQPPRAPARIPVKFDDDSRPRLDFSKSLPPGALRPTAIDHLKRQELNEFSTPKNDFQSAKPHAGAFASTGLISKVNHNPEVPQSSRHHRRGSIMPDTPCKKPLGHFNTVPAPGTNAGNKVKEFSRHSFGTPSVFGSAMKPAMVNRNVFGADFSNKNRRGSFLSIAQDNHTSPDVTEGFLSDSDMPPTPTKSIFNDVPGNGSPKSLSRTSLSMFNGFNKTTRPSSKLFILTNTVDSSDDDDAFGDIVSPTTVSFRFTKSSSKSSSFGRSRARKGSSAPAPLSLKSPKAFLSPTHQSRSNMPTLIADSPSDRVDLQEQISPQTPHVGVGDLSEDASRLTVSGQSRRVLTRQNTLVDSVAKAPPATPTTGRDAILPNGGVTPVHVPKAADVDEHLAARFDKVESIGSGEFSDVYRVTKMDNFFANQSFYFAGSFGTPAAGTPQTPRVSVFAVKKSRKQFTGPTDKAKKMREVNVLEALGHTDHIIQYFDSWEIDGYLYIQTEFCEEGSLDSFLMNTGRKGRLDDFRIWKIMVELGEGIKHIHRSGFMHLDLKPANVFITFEGCLKIGDFGMAVPYPAPADIDGEGDREYIGPEVLDGKFTPAADIFAFGLIMLEIAGNVQLPDNGPSWTKLRSGDFSDMPSLTWSDASTLVRDASGNPIVDDSDTSMDSFLSEDEMDMELPPGSGRKRNFNPTKTRSASHDPANLFGSIRSGELKEGPKFMTEQYHESSLHTLVKRMMRVDPLERPSITELLRTEGVKWVRERRRAGATVYEGNWGPGDEQLGGNGGMLQGPLAGAFEDAVMVDV